MMRRAVVVVAALGGAMLGACNPGDLLRSPLSGPVAPPIQAVTLAEPQLWYDPYDGIAWETTLRLKAQTHDHAGISSARILSYDSAGYDFVPLMDYSGVASLPFAQRRRLWPADSVLSSTLRSQVRNVRAWIPAAEEVGYQHLISLFLTQYIAKWEPLQYASREAWMYGDAQDAIRQIDQRGGFAILAHPWGHSTQFDGLAAYDGIEIYSAFAEQKFAEGLDPFFASRNRNLDIVEAWDRALLSGRLVVGVAVNDHHGPYRSTTAVVPRIRDSGKILVLTDSANLAGFERAMRRGAILAVADFGATKGAYPRIDSVWVDGDLINVATEGEVTWVINGTVLAGHSASLQVSRLPRAARFARAEVRGLDGSTVYLQPFLLRPRGDVDGDFLVNRRDDELCAAVEAGTDTLATHRRACAGRAGPELP